jgi:hypothetical protein
MSKDQLMEEYKDKDLEKELKFTADHLISGYFRLRETDYIRWLCYAYKQLDVD